MGDGRPCLYDDAARAAFGGSPVSIPDVRAALSGAQTDLLDAAGVVLAASTAALRDAVRDEVSGAEVLLLVYLPSVLDAGAPHVKRANVPLGWASPAYDVLQLEDYDWVVAGNAGATGRGIAAATARLGYAANGDSVRGAIEGLAALGAMSITDDGETLFLTDAAPAATALPEGELGATGDGKRAVRRAIERQATGTLPDEIAIAYYEPARDYQAGLQRARRGGPGRRVEKIELPAAVTANEAKAFAEGRLATVWSERTQAMLTLPWRRMELRPGGRVSTPGSSRTWRIAGWTIDRMVTELKLVATSSRAASGVAAVPGRVTGGVDAPYGPTTFQLIDLPPLDDIQTPRLWVAAAGVSPSWRRAALTMSLDGGTSWTATGRTAAPAVMGTAMDVLGAGSAALFDRVNSFEVMLLNDSMWLESCTDAALLSGANLAMLGDELIQFGSAEQIGPGRFGLSRLMRGRRGSEWAIAGHAADERFVLIEAAALAPLELSSAAIGSVVKVMAEGIGDGGVAVNAEAYFLGRALRPPPPVNLSAERLGDGTIRIGWTRRSRAGWTWLDGGDAPLGEEAERYRLTITPSVGAVRTVESDWAGYDYGISQQGEDGSMGAGAITVAVAQLGSVAASLPAATGTFGV